MQENIKLTGHLVIEVKDKDGNIKETFKYKNLVVTSGKTFMASRMVGTSINVMSHMAIGTGTTAAAVGNTTLVTEVGRVGLSSSTASDVNVTYTTTFPAGVGTGNITEAAIFNASSAGVMLCRTTFPTVTKGSADSISINWICTVN